MWNDRPHSSYLIHLSSDFLAFFSGENTSNTFLANLKYNMLYIICFTRLCLDFWNSFILYNWIFVPSDQHLLSPQQVPDDWYSALFYELGFSRFHIQLRQYNIFLCCLIPFHDVLHVHSCYLTWKDVLFWRMNYILLYMSHFLYYGSHERNKREMPLQISSCIN